MLDSSGRLRVDERRLSLPLQDLCQQVGSNAAPGTADIRRPADLNGKLAVPARDQSGRLPAAPPRESSVIVYCGNEVNEGFAIALRLMGLHANCPPPSDPLPTTGPNREDN
jgi:hypothetical protein